ncbi:MAG TPA: flagellar basal body P-ring formation chaperone FlgA [Eoetvoesiella sp.]
MLKYLAIFTLTCAALSGHAIAAASAGVPDPSALIKDVEEFLKGQTSGYPGTARITVDAPDVAKLTVCKHTQVFLPSGSRLRSRMNIGIRCLAPEPWITYTQASLSIQGVYYVPAHTLKPGTTLSRDNLNEREANLLALPSSVVFDPDLLIGSITTQRITAGSPIKSSALRSPDSIQRGQAVRLEARGVGFVATSEGQALQNGAPGALIKIRTGTGQTVSGTVLNSSTVLVTM